MAQKVFVKVEAIHDLEGKIIPQAVIWEDGRRFEVDRIMDICRAASLKAGGVGIRYTCRIRHKVIYLFVEENKWFMEGIE